jgi:hypothetical protein
MIGVYMQTLMTEEQYREVDEKIRATGIEPKGMKLHTCFGAEEQLAIFDVWESTEDFEACAVHLGPIFGSMGLEPIAPDIVPMVDFRTL